MTRHSKKLSWLLRHGALEVDLEMDAAGWVRVKDVCRVLKLTEHDLKDAIANNKKKRIERVGDRVRCSQGHSSGMPVTLDALEASWSTWTSDRPLFHATRAAVVEQIFAEGLKPGERTHVHLAKSRDAKVGKRANVNALLVVDPRVVRAAGLSIYESPNGVILIREVPASAITLADPARVL